MTKQPFSVDQSGKLSADLSDIICHLQKRLVEFNKSYATNGKVVTPARSAVARVEGLRNASLNGVSRENPLAKDSGI